MENPIGPGTNETGYDAGKWDTSFDVGVEAIVGFPGKMELYDRDDVTTPLTKAIVALHPDLKGSMISYTFAQSYREVTHVTIKVNTGNEASAESSLDQEVWKNLTSVMQDAETAQVFLSAALNCGVETPAATPCTPALYAQTYYMESQRTGSSLAASPDFYALAQIPAAVLQVPEVLASGTPAPEVGALTGPISMVKPLTFIYDMPVSPVVMCFPKGAGAETSSATAGAMALGLPLLGLSWALIAGFVAYKAYRAGGCKKMCEACKDNDGEDDEDSDDDDDIDMPIPMDLPAPDVQKLAAPGEEGEDEDDGFGDDPENESGVNLAGFLNTMYTPGIDDSTEMKVNPVLMYVIEKEKRERKLREAREAEENGDGDGEAAKAEETTGGGEGGEKKSSALKRLGWNLKSEAVVADVAKQLKVIETHMTSDGIEVKKVNYKKATKAGMVPFSVLDAVRLRGDDFNSSSGKLHSRAKAMSRSAEAARAQLRQMKLKTKVENEAVEAKEDAGEEGEEGEEGEKDLDV